MGLISRIKLLLRLKAQSALNSAENPLQVLDYAAAQQQELLRKLRQGLTEVATSRRQLENEAGQLRSELGRLDDQARRALAAGHEELARLSLQKKQIVTFRLEDLGPQIAQVAEEERKLSSAERQLAARIEDFQAHRRIISAKYNAAEAQLQVNQALTGVWGEFAELGMALGRAEEKTEQMQARAYVISEFIERGFPEIANGDPVDRELRQLASAQTLELQIAELKAELRQGQQYPVLDAGSEADGEKE